MSFGPKTAALRALILLTALAALSLVPIQASAQCELPLEVQANTVLPNVMILLDSSVSMREAIHHPDYDYQTPYSGVFDRATDYVVSVDGNYEPNDFDPTYPSSPSAPLVQSEGNDPGIYPGNYLNWIYFHATNAQRAALPQTTRFEVAKAAMTTIVTNVQGARWGITKFNGNNGGTIVSGVSASQNSFLSQIDGIKADAWSPAAEAMVSVWDYFQDDDATSAPIQYECQNNSVIFISDGYPTQDLDVPAWVGDQDGDGNEPGSCTSIGAPLPDDANCSDYLDDVAYYMAHNDARPDLEGEQRVTTYTIQLAEEVPLLVETAINGGGTHHFASNLPGLLRSMETILSQIEERVASGTAVSVISSEQVGQSRLYRAKYLAGRWTGYLECFGLPYQDGDTPLWEAGALLRDRAASTRNIFTLHDGSTLSFDASAASELQSDLGAADEQEAEDIINFIRGEFVDGMRQRAGWKLGDIIHSAPLVVGAPDQFHLQEDYQQFLADHANRPEVVYAGANDGMFHAFDAATGQELWAYVPRAVQSRLKDYTSLDYCHLNYVDLSPVAYDVSVNGSWKTVVIGGLRGGGDAYFALDVTIPTLPQLLWETSVPAIFASYTKPVIVRSSSGSYVWTGSGPDIAGQAAVSLINVSNGEVVFAANVGPLHSDVNMASQPTLFDANLDGYTDFVYQGDLAGNLWKWDVRAADPSAWTGMLLFTADGPIQARPSLSVAEDGSTLLFFGTGRFVVTDDLHSTTDNRFYCVKDDGMVSNLTSSDLVDQTNAISDPKDAHGWLIDLEQADGERVTEQAMVIAGVVYFTSYSPEGGACTSGGTSWLYHVDYRDGSSPNEEQQDDETSNRVETIGTGIASQPVAILHDGELLVQTSDARLTVRDMAMEPLIMRVRSWTEVIPGR